MGTSGLTPARQALGLETNSTRDREFRHAIVEYNERATPEIVAMLQGFAVGPYHFRAVGFDLWLRPAVVRTFVLCSLPICVWNGATRRRVPGRDHEN